MARAKGNTGMKIIASSTDKSHLSKDSARHPKGCTCQLDRYNAGVAFWDLIAKSQRNNNGK